ncbi:unnamed protein product, partial [Ixodes pacificus]
EPLVPRFCRLSLPYLSCVRHAGVQRTMSFSRVVKSNYLQSKFSPDGRFLVSADFSRPSHNQRVVDLSAFFFQAVAYASKVIVYNPSPFQEVATFCNAENVDRAE